MALETLYKVVHGRAGVFRKSVFCSKNGKMGKKKVKNMFFFNLKENLVIDFL